MSTRPHPPPSVAALAVLGFALGAIGVLLLALLVLALSLLVNATWLVVIGTAFGDARLVGLPYAGPLAALATATLLGWLCRRWLLPALAAARPLGVAGASATLLGAALAMALGVWSMPEAIRQTAVQFMTGQTAQQRAEAPAVQARRQRLQAIVDAAPDGPEAALLANVDRVATPALATGRVLGDADVQARVGALRRLQPTLPPAWWPVLIGTIGEMTQAHAGQHPADAASRDARVEAGRAGSRALTVLAAEHDEGLAHRHEASGEQALADPAWRRALAGYATAGAAFEVARLYDETLPERLRSLPAPAASTYPAPDGAFSQRLWRFAQALGDDAAYPHAPPGQRDLAQIVALVALERAPDAPQIALRNPAQRWATDPWALGRWVLALRHARGDCVAALQLSDATRERRRPAVVNERAPPASSLDLAWALAWAEAGEACARSDHERLEVRARRDRLDYLNFAPGELDAARAGVAASLAALR